MNLEINKYLNKVKELPHSKHLMTESLLKKEKFEQILSNPSKLLVWKILERF